MSASTIRHPHTGSPLVRYEVHERGLDLMGVPCGIVPNGTPGGDNPTCTDPTVARLVSRFMCGGLLVSPICRVHLGSILEQLGTHGTEILVITPGMN